MSVPIFQLILFGIQLVMQINTDLNISLVIII